MKNILCLFVINKNNIIIFFHSSVWLLGIFIFFAIQHKRWNTISQYTCTHTSQFLEISFNKSNFTSPKMDKKLKGTLINFSSVASSVCSYDINNHKEFLSFPYSVSSFLRKGQAGLFQWIFRRKNKEWEKSSTTEQRNIQILVPNIHDQA